MLYLGLTLFVLLNAAALAIVLVGLPGNWLMVAFTWLLAWWQWDRHLFGLPVLIAIIALAAFGELMEFLSGAMAVRKSGGTKRGTVGAILGAIVFGIIGTAMVPIPGIGSILGACVGAFLGAMGMELSSGRTTQESVRSGVGAGIGQFLGTSAKFIVGVIIWIMVTIAVFWP